MMGKELYKTVKDAGDVLKMQLRAAVAASDEVKINVCLHFKSVSF